MRVSRKVSRLFRETIGSGLAAKAILLFFIVGVLSALACAQRGTMTPYQNEQDGVSAGGKWQEFDTTEKMTGAKKVRFELLSDNYFREEPDYKPIDKGTVRGLIGAQVFNVELPTRSGRPIAEFSPGGLNLDRVRQACDLTSKKPSKD